MNDLPTRAQVDNLLNACIQPVFQEYLSANDKPSAYAALQAKMKTLEAIGPIFAMLTLAGDAPH